MTTILQIGDASAAEIAQPDALHIATMQRMKVKSILSFDSDFDRWPGLTRIHRV
jgi:predicted nucleic acid-binding protein